MAKKRLEGKGHAKEWPANDYSKLIEELIIHQEELNIQNEELIKVQVELEASRARYFELYDLAPVGYITFTSELVIKEANLAASKILGAGRKNLINKRLSSFVSPQSQESVYLHYRRLANGTEKQVNTFLVRKKDGKELYVRFESNLVEGASGAEFRSVLTDVTKLKRVEDANAELQQFVYVASHDLQEPLRMVVSYLSLLDRKYKDNLDHEALGYIKYAVEGGTRMRSLIDDLLEYSRLDYQETSFLLVDMNAVVAKALGNLKLQIEEHKTNIVVDTLPSLLADETQMVQLMQNLIGNAIKFHGRNQSEVHISVTASYQKWTFAVKDNGIGLNMEYSEKIFQMFQRLHGSEEFPGTGIGLAIAKKIVERHDGKIWVESEEGKGATFFFTVPKEMRTRKLREIPEN